MMHAIQISETGASNVLEFVEVSDPEPAPGEALVEIQASGVNFIDVYKRRGLYPVPLPFVPGEEGAGVVTSVGGGVADVLVGDRVAFAGVTGAYAELIAVPVDRLVRVPDGMEIQDAAAIMLQGLTAHYLTHDCYPLGPGSVCLIHAGAGGVGQLLIQMAKSLGATVVATTGTPEKAELARRAGADHTIVYTEVDFAEAAASIVGDDGLDVVYDSVGADTFDRSLGLVKRWGTMVLFGQASGPVPPSDLSRLGSGSVFITRPRLGDFIHTTAELRRRAADLLEWVASGELVVRIGARYPLPEAARAHDALTGRATTGKVLLLP